VEVFCPASLMYEMARPKPPPERAPIPKTVTIEAAVLRAAEKQLASGNRNGPGNLSALVTIAILEYAQRHHPDLLKESIEEIKAESAQRPAARAKRKA
jgi:hypothetical protein